MGGSRPPLIFYRRGRTSDPKPPLSLPWEARRTRGWDSSTGSKFGVEITPQTLAATAAEVAIIKLGGGGCAAAVEATEPKHLSHGCCCSLMPF